LMGSVFALQAPECKVDKLRELEQSGIGERRIEGFGRVAVNWYQSSELVTHDQAVYRSMETGRTFTSTAGRKLAELMVNRLWRAALDDAVMAKANQLGSLVKQPRKSQLARLRMAVQNAMRQPPGIGRGALDRYLKGLGDRQVTRRQFEHDRVQGRSLLEWLRTRAHDETAIWTDLDAGVPPSLGDVKAGLTPALAYEYNLRLIDAVLARAAKEKEA
ncbi:MAG: hypothetical protein M1546_23995, partial [Chloroflexi bacterium]|nr:hypothetical protein [Chloroflexota bacterium]